MARVSPRPISPAERRARHARIGRLARKLGFVGQVEYRHVYSQTGGAQYGQGATVDDDLLTVYAEAFERDSDPEDFTLEAIIAHERGHQLLARHTKLAKRIAGRLPEAGEEILASILGAIVCDLESDRDALIAKATLELVEHGEQVRDAVHRIQDLRNLLRSLL